MGVRHEQLDLRVWDQNYAQWASLAPWESVQLDHRADLSVDTLTVMLSDKHPAMPRLRTHRNVPVPVTLAVNGVQWSGMVTTLKQTSDGTVTVTVSSDDKHLHRMLARAREAAAVDSETADITGQVGTVLADLAASAAQRTGLPIFINVQHKGDMVKVQAKADDTVADVVDSALTASDTFASVRMIIPGLPLPEGELVRIQGVAEGTWEQACIDQNLWPHVVNNRVRRTSVAPPVAPTPHLSWFGAGEYNHLGHRQREAQPGICWVPFITTEQDRGYWQDGDTAVRFATKEELWAARRPGWHEHITHWEPGTFTSSRPDVKLLDQCARAGLLTKPDGTQVRSRSAAVSYIGGQHAYAWWTGAGWVLANHADFQVEDKRRQPTDSSRVTPALMVQTRGVRDRRNIVFSSAPGGGLESWENSTTSPEAAMIHASAQLDETVLKAIQAGSLTMSTQVGKLDEGQLKQVIGAVNDVPEVVDYLDVSATPFATISGTDLAYSRLGGRVNIDQAGPFFYREMALSLGNSGANPVADMGREWAKAQGSTTLTLTPGYGTSTVFGDDVEIDGRVVPGWKPGDRVSFVDGRTRMSELVTGFNLEKRWDGPLVVTPLLGRADNGVMDQVMGRVRKAEQDSQKALTQAPRRAPVAELFEKVAEAPVVKEIQKDVEKRPTAGELNSEIGELNRKIDPLNNYLTLEKQNQINRLQQEMWGKQGQVNQLTEKFKEETRIRFEEDEKLWVKQREIDREQTSQTELIERRTPIIVPFKNDVAYVTAGGESLGALYVDGRSGDLRFEKKGDWSGSCAAIINVKALNSYTVTSAWHFSSSQRLFTAAVGTFENISSGLVFVIRD